MVKKILFLMVLMIVGLASVCLGQCCLQCFIDPVSGCFECWSSDNIGGFSCRAGPGCYDCTNSSECDFPGGGGCFLGAVLITTPDGDVPIPQLEVGDKIVPGVNGVAGKVETITATHITEVLSYLEINDSLMVTRDHPFKVGDEWVVAGDLELGDLLNGVRGDVVVKSLREVWRGVRVFNITTSGPHTFVAGGVVVHNKPPLPGG